MRGQSYPPELNHRAMILRKRGILYICEGAKYPAARQLGFANTDPRMIRFFVLLLRQHQPQAIGESVLEAGTHEDQDTTDAFHGVLADGDVPSYEFTVLKELVEQEGIEPSNLRNAIAALSQLSYCPQ